MTSALEARPKLRDDIKIVRRESHGQVHYIVKQPLEGKYYQFGEVEVGLMRLMDGERTPDGIADAADSTLGVRPPAGQIADFAQKLKRMGIVERTQAEQHLMLMEHLRTQRRIRSRGHTQGSILRLRFSIGDPDRLFDWIVARIRWAWSPPFVIASLGLFAVYFFIIVTRRQELWDGMVGLFTLSGFGVWDWILLYVAFLAIAIPHELGHGLTTKYFGGEVHEIGAMLFYFNPALFCNTSDAWTFERRSHRLWVTAAGPWIQLMLAALAGIVWVTTEPDTFINTFAFLTFLVGGVASVLGNMNPLLPLDGYYALSDWLEVPSLRPRAFEYWNWIGKRVMLGLDVAEPAVTPRERRIFIIYGGLALLYSVFVTVISFIWLIAVIGRFLGPWVWAILAYVLGAAILRSLGRGEALASAATTTLRAGFLRGGRGWALLVVAVLLVGLPFVLPWTFRARGEFIVESMPRAYVRAQVDGILDRWQVREGQAVEAGDAIAALWSPEIESAFLEAEARAGRLEINRAEAEASGDLGAAAAASSALVELQQELAVLRARKGRLIVRAPIAGVVLGHRLHERLGVAIAEGTLLVEIASPRARYARIRVPLKKAGEVSPGQSVSLKLVARPYFKFKSTVETVAPAAGNGWLEADVPLPAGEWQARPGMIGIAKIVTRRGTIAQALTRAFRQTVRIDLWL